MLPQALAGKGGQESSQPAHQAKHIQELVDLLKRNNITELELEQDGVRIRVRQEVGGKAITAAVTDAAAAQGVTTTAAQPAIAPSQPTGDQGGLVTITSPIVGTFYRSPSPDADPYVEEGDMVKKGQVLCIVEAMKLMNEIESEVDGKVVKILAESTKPVEYGQALFHIDPKASA
jgi:acetyl-CoA carboxylase biotin carboxyl carrier protein